MTSTPSTTEPEEPAFPTEWHLINILTNVDCRQLSEDIYQLRDYHSIITIDKVGFDLYREDSKLYEKYINDNNVEAYPREPNG